MLVILIFGQVCRQSADGYVIFTQVFYTLQSLNYLLFDQFLSYEHSFRGLHNPRSKINNCNAQSVDLQPKPKISIKRNFTVQ